MKPRCANLIALAMVVLPSAWCQTSSGPSASPAALTFNYTVNSTTLPASAKLTVSLPSTASSATVISVVPTYPAGTPPTQTWLTVAPAQGHAPLALVVVANPTSLPPGSYNATLSVTTNPNVGSLSVPVTLSISNPPANLVVNPGFTTANFTPASGTTPDTLSFAYTTGTPWNVRPSELDVSTNGGIIPFNVTAANAAGSGSKGGTTAVWLRVAPGPPAASGQPALQTSGVAVAGSSVPITVSLDQTSVQSLLPGSYGGTVTFAANSAANGSHLVAVNLVVSAGPPVLFSIFPTSIVQVPTVNPMISINGQNFFSTSVVTIAPAGVPDAVNNVCTQSGAPSQLSSQLLSQTAMTATVSNAQTLFAKPGPWCVCVTNPAPPNAPGQPPACAPTPNLPTQPIDYTFNVISSSTIAVSSVLNAASYQQSAKQTGTDADPVAVGQTSIAPGEIISIFGQNLGPSTPLPATPSATPAMLTSGAPLAAFLSTSTLGTTLQFTVSGTGVIVNFAGDLKASINEAPTDIVAYINSVTKTAGLGSSVASVQTVLGSNYITLSSPATGSAATIKVKDNTAAQLLKLTSGTGDVQANGADLAFPFQLNNIQVAVEFTDAIGFLTTLYAPIIMVSSNQVNAMAPSGLVSGIGGTATLVVQNNGSSASFANIALVNENPGIFTLSGQGSGQAAVLNYDATSGSYTINSSKNTAPRGSTVVIFATGLGTLQPPGLADGLGAPVADKVADPVQVTIAGQPCVVTYAGTSPGSLGGLTQINALVPPTVATGQAVSITLAGGTAQTARQSQAGVTLAVK